MANINQMGNDYENIKSLTLYNSLKLNTGEIIESGTVDGLIVSTTTLYSVPITVTEPWTVSDIIFNLVDNTGLTGAPVLSIGTNSATYDNLMPSTTLTGFNALTDTYRYQVTGVNRKLYGGDVLTLNLTTAYGGTSVHFNVKIIGGYIS